MPRRKKKIAPPGLAEDPAALAAEAEAAPDPDPKVPGEQKGAGRARKPGKKAARESERAPAPVPEIPFPVEALAMMHGMIWNGLSKRLRSQYELSEQGALEMATYAEVCIRQYLGPYLAQHAALTAYLMTQAAALAALVMLKETKPPKQDQGARIPGTPEPLYHRPITDAELRPPIGSAA